MSKTKKPKLKLRKGTLYPFKHLLQQYDTFTTHQPTKNVRASWAMFKKKEPGFDVLIEAYEDGSTLVTRLT